MPEARAGFGSAEVEALADRVVAALASGSLPEPASEEAETSYTARAIFPALADSVDALEIDGLLLKADGGPTVAPMAFLGQRFRPDFTLTYRGRELLVAGEVKFLRSSNRSGSISTALGQALLYNAAGFSQAVVVLVDHDNHALTRDLVEKAGVMLQSLEGVRLVVLRPDGRGLVSSPV